MIRTPSLPLVAAPPSVRKLPLNQIVDVTGTNGERLTGRVMREINLKGAMAILHIGKIAIGSLQIADDFDHVKIEGLPKIYLISEITLIAIDDD